MLRKISDNIEIDTQLISNAEYQLFIDEKLMSEFYFQPDHWLSNRFAFGTSKFPVTGIRASDAKAFCEWLTTQQDSDLGFIYRVPTIDESREFPLPGKGIGYWCSNGDSFEIKGLNSNDKETISKSLFNSISLLNPLDNYFARKIITDLFLDFDEISNIASKLIHDLIYNVDIEEDLEPNIYIANDVSNILVLSLLNFRFLPTNKREILRPTPEEIEENIQLPKKYDIYNFKNKLFLRLRNTDFSKIDFKGITSNGFKYSYSSIFNTFIQLQNLLVNTVHSFNKLNYISKDEIAEKQTLNYIKDEYYQKQKQKEEERKKKIESLISEANINQQRHTKKIEKLIREIENKHYIYKFSKSQIFKQKKYIEMTKKALQETLNIEEDLNALLLFSLKRSHTHYLIPTTSYILILCTLLAILSEEFKTRDNQIFLKYTNINKNRKLNILHQDNLELMFKSFIFFAIILLQRKKIIPTWGGIRIVREKNHP